MSQIKSLVNFADSKMPKIRRINERKDDRAFTEKLKVPWYFTTLKDKLFLFVLLLLSMYAVFRILFTGFW